MPAADAKITGMDARPLTRREQELLGALLTTDFPHVDELRDQAGDVVVVGICGCGCPSIDFRHGRGLGMTIRVDATVRKSPDGLFLYTIVDPQRGEFLGGIEWVGIETTDPAELPSPDLLDIRPA